MTLILAICSTKVLIMGPDELKACKTVSIIAKSYSFWTKNN